MSENIFTLPEKIDGIYDIQPPPAPGLSTIEFSLIIISVILLSALFFYFYWKTFYSVKSRNIRNIKRLRKSLGNNEEHTRNTIYRFTGYLKQALNLKQIDNNTQLPVALTHNPKNIQRWKLFTNQLSDIRYKKHTDCEIKPILDEALYWLKSWPG